MDKISVNFITDYENNNKWFLFDDSCTVEYILKKFLEETNSEINLDSKKIIFMFKNRILNRGTDLNKRIREVFRHDNAIKIRVIDHGNIIAAGGPLTETFIIFNEYKNFFITLHKKLAEFFNENYSNMNYDYTYKNNFIDFINSQDIDNKNQIIRWINEVNSGTVTEFIQAYTGETPLCYSLNKWLRQCIPNDYEKIKYFAGPFSYSLYKYAYNDSRMRVNFSKTFYRKMVVKSKDYEKYKNYIGQLICYPAFTSTSDKDISKYTFPTPTAINVNNIKDDDVYVVLIIEYKCNNSSYPTPCINVSYDSVNAEEHEHIFPPFSFFKIEKVENRGGINKDPHIIYMNVPNKRILIEFAIKNNKSIYYDENLNELYSS